MPLIPSTPLVPLIPLIPLVPLIPSTPLVPLIPSIPLVPLIPSLPLIPSTLLFPSTPSFPRGNENCIFQILSKLVPLLIMLKVALLSADNVLTVIFPSVNEADEPLAPTIPPHEKPIEIFAPLLHMPLVCFKLM